MQTIQKVISKSIGIYFNILAYLFPKKLKIEGYNLFCTPLSKKLKPHHQVFLDSGKLDVFMMDSQQIQHYSWGNGTKKVLLVHGWGSHTFRWKSYIETLVKNDFTVLAFDAPAHGNSTGKILNIGIYERTIDSFLKLNTDVEAILAHSIGGFASTYYLSKNPQSSIKKAVILASPTQVSEFFEYFVQLLGLSQKAISLIENQFEIELKQKPSYFSAIDFAKNIKTEAFIIHDKDDKSTKSSGSKKLSEAWKGSKLKITTGLGHELKSEELMVEILNFIG